MADTMQFDLVSPEKMLLSVPVRAVHIPGAEGDFTAMPGHTPFISTLRPGVVVAETAEGEMRFVVTGGFAEITGDSVSLLAERGLLAEEFRQPQFEEYVAEARAMRDSAEGPALDANAKHFADIMELGRQLGFQASNV